MAIKNFKEILNKEAKRVDIKDRKIFERGRMPAFFGRGMTDTIEFILYDNGNNQLPQGEDGKLVRYVNISEIDNIRNYLLIARGTTSNKSPEYFVDVEKLINEAGYKNGLFRTQITLLNKRVGSEHFQNKVWIHEISPSRTEIRVLPIKTEDASLEKDLRDRYNILLENGEFRDDILNRLDGFIDSIDANNVLKKILALYGQDWINNVKREFKIQDFDGFINDVTVKAKQAIGYYISNRGYTFGKSDYGKPLKDDLQASKDDRKRRNRRGRKRKTNSQRLDIKTLMRKSNEIICDSVRFHLPKRNLQIQSTPTLTKLESRDKISTILQTFGTSKKIDTQITRPVRISKPVKLVSAQITTKKVEKPAPDKAIKIALPSKKYYFYDVYFRRKGFFRRGTAVVSYVDMSGDVNSFSLPAGKRVRICAEEGTVKAKTNPKRVSIIKKELCKVDTPVPKFVRPKRPPLRSDLSKEQNDVIKDLKLPKDDNVKIKYPISVSEIKGNIKKAFAAFPKVKFNIMPTRSVRRRGRPTPRPIPITRRNRRKNRRVQTVKPRAVRRNKRNRRVRNAVVIPPARLSFAQRKRNFTRRRSRPSPAPTPTPARTTFRGRTGTSGAARPGGFGSGRIQNRFTPGNTFTGYSRGGY